MPFELATPRADAWYADLTEEQLWQLYAVAKRTGDWTVAAKVAREEFKVEREISRSSFYRWRDWMRSQDSNRRLASARAAVIEAEEMAKKTGISDEAMIKAYKSLAAEAALSAGDADRATKFVMMAMALRDREQKDAELKLKSARQKTADDQLKLAREKFEAAEKRLAAMAELSDAARGGKVDPAKVADEIDRILGRKK